MLIIQRYNLFIVWIVINVEHHWLQIKIYVFNSDFDWCDCDCDVRQQQQQQEIICQIKEKGETRGEIVRFGNLLQTPGKR